jgi:hypothetical protein
MQESLRSTLRNLGEYAPKVSERLYKLAKTRRISLGNLCICSMHADTPHDTEGLLRERREHGLRLVARATGQHLGVVLFRSSSLPHVSWLAAYRDSREPPANIRDGGYNNK